MISERQRRSVEYELGGLAAPVDILDLVVFIMRALIPIPTGYCDSQAASQSYPGYRSYRATGFGLPVGTSRY
jgi:hypothetical protein